MTSSSPLKSDLGPATSRAPGADLQAPARGPVFGVRGAAAAGNPRATLAGIDVLRAGGNAIDAAIAASAVLVVVQPYASHLGGDAFTLVRTAGGETLALNAGGRAPLAATLDRFPQGVPLRGPSAVTVPGLVDAWCALHARLATKPLAELLAPAVALAEEGFPVSQQLAFSIRAVQETLAADPGCAGVFLRDGPPRTGTPMRQPDLARTLRAIGERGRDGFYAGEAGERLVALMRERGGLIGAEDLARDQAVWGEPLSIDYRGWTVYEQPLPSQGFLTLEALNIVEGFDLAQGPLDSAGTMHKMAEAMRLAFADRDAYAGDPEAVDVPIDRLLSKEHAAELRGRISSSASGGPATALHGGDTISLAAADGAGNLVSFIQSVYQPWGAAVLVPGTGVLLNDRMTGFSLDPQSPNALRPGMRTVHTLNTWLLERDDGRIFAGGTPGAQYQVQTNLQVISALVDRQLDAQAALATPRWVLAEGGALALEARFPQATFDELQRRGHTLRRLPAWDVSVCRSQVVGRNPATGVVLAASDLRGEGAALAV